MKSAKVQRGLNINSDHEDEILESFIGAFPTIAGAIDFAKQLGVRVDDIPSEIGLRAIWDRLFFRMRKNNSIATGIEQILRRNRAGSKSEFLRSLLDNKAIPVNALPPRGSSALFDRVEEAKLFYDDLREDIAMLPSIINTLRKMQRLANSVCRVIVKTAAGVIGKGTGFRIDDTRILTNYHVLFPNDQDPLTVEATFGFNSEGQSNIQRLPADVSSIVGDHELDWATIVVHRMRRTWTPIPVDDFEPPSYDAPVYVIQHPGGGQKRIAYARNRVKLIEPLKIGYTADTDSGSSGSPVLSANGKLVALHRTGGIEQKNVGDIPVAFNEGILAQAILKSMKMV